MNNKCIKYYYNYLGLKNNKIDKKNIIVSSIDRKKLINKEFNYPIIVSYIKSNIIISIIPEYYIEFKYYLDKFSFNYWNEENLKYIISNFLKDKLLNFEIKMMYRMFKTQKSNIDVSEVIEITEEVKEFYMNSFVKNNDISYKKKKWKSLKNKAVKRYYVWSSI